MPVEEASSISSGDGTSPDPRRPACQAVERVAWPGSSGPPRARADNPTTTIATATIEIFLDLADMGPSSTPAKASTFGIGSVKGPDDRDVTSVTGPHIL
jgi:hypothetical protein